MLGNVQPPLRNGVPGPPAPGGESQRPIDEELLREFEENPSKKKNNCKVYQNINTFYLFLLSILFISLEIFSREKRGKLGARHNYVARNGDQGSGSSIGNNQMQAEQY